MIDVSYNVVTTSDFTIQYYYNTITCRDFNCNVKILIKTDFILTNFVLLVVVAIFVVDVLEMKTDKCHVY